MKSPGDVDETGAEVRRAAWIRPRGDVDETGAKVRRGGLCEAIKKPRAAKGGKGQMLQLLPAYGGRAAFFRAIPD